MYWQLTIPENDPEKLSASITVKAENWYSALKDGLEKQGVDSKWVSNLSCRIEPDQSVIVTDFISRRVYRLRPLDTEAQSGAPEAAEVAGAEADRRPVPALPDGLAPHTLFYARDEASPGGEGIFYRERLLVVDPGLTRDQVGRLIHAYFQQLKAMGPSPETRLFVSVQVFDHAFENEARRPAIAALTWREWYPDKPRILFPLSGEESVTFSKLPADPTAAPQAASEAAPQTVPQAPPKRKPSITPPPGDIFAADDKMIQAFEGMQEIYGVEDHDSAAEFGLDLSMRLIACEAGRAMLFAPGKYELYVAAARGPGAELLKERKFSLKRGIIGFATQNSVVINVAEPENDPRFESDIDAQAGFHTRSVLCAPIQYEGRTLGALELLNSPNRRGFKQAEVNILAYIGSALAEYLEKSLPSREADFHDKDFSG